MFTLGGATSGYCAIGSARMDATPARMITIEITHAKTGRLAKNLASMSLPRSGGTRARTRRARGQSGRARCRRRGALLCPVNRHARPDLVRALDDHLVAVLQAVLDEPPIAARTR